MNNLISDLEIDLININILDIDEELLIKLKEKDKTIKDKFYFYLLDRIIEAENSKDTEKISYSYYLMSYYLFLIYTPFLYEELSYKYAYRAYTLSEDFKYKEWMLFFTTIEKKLLDSNLSFKIANEILNCDPNHQIANMVILMN